MDLRIDTHYIENNEFHIKYTLTGRSNQSYDRKRVSKINTNITNNELIDFYIDTYEPKDTYTKFVKTEFELEDEPIFKLYTIYFVRFSSVPRNRYMFQHYDI